MMRRITLAIFFLVFCATAAWPKWKEDEQKYLDDQFKVLQDQIQALTTLVQSLNGQVATLRDNQAQIREFLTTQQRAMQELDDLTKSLSIHGDENLSTMKDAITRLNDETQKAIRNLCGRQTGPEGGGGGTGGEKPTSEAPKAQGYIIDVSGSNVTVGLGSAQGIREGSHLAVFKAGDPNTRVGVLEVTQVVDAGNSRARIVNLNSGVKLEFSDIVRVE